MKKRNIFVSTMLCGIVMSSVITPSVVQGAAVLDSGEVENKKEITIPIRFVGGRYYQSGKISGTVGSTVNIEDKLPDGFELDDGEPSFIEINEKYINGITIKVVGKEMTGHVHFVDPSDAKTDFEPVDISGRVEEFIDITKFLPKGYKFKYDLSYYFFLDYGKSDYNVSISKIENEIVDNPVIFTTEDGIKIGNPMKISGRDGDEFSLDNLKLPEGYVLSENNQGNIIISNNDQIQHTVYIKKKETVINRIQFVTDDGEIVGKDSYVVEGKPKDKINLDDFEIFDRYELSNLDQTFTFNQEIDYLHKILVESKYKTRIVNFIDSVTHESIGSTEVHGYIGDKVEVNPWSLPDGYNITRNYSRALIIPRDKKTIDFVIDNEKNIYKNKIEFIDENGTTLHGAFYDRISGMIGEIVEVKARDLPDGFDFADDKRAFKIDLTNIPHIVRVKAQNTSSRVKFIDWDSRKQIGQIKEISGKVGTKFEFSLKDISDNYEFVPSNNFGNYKNASITLYKGVPEYQILIRKKQITNTIIFVDRFGKNVNSFNIRGNEGQIISHEKLQSDSEYPEFILDDTQYKMGKDGSTIFVKVSRNYVDKKLIFVDSKNKELGIELHHRLKVGTTFEVNKEYIPKGYKLVGKEYSIQILDDGKEQIIIKVQPLQIKNHFKLIEFENKSNVISEIDITGKTGDEIHLSQKQIGNGYKQFGSYHLSANNEEDKFIYVSKIVSNTINYYSPEGKLLDSRVVHGSLQDTIKLNAPKGYINPDNFNTLIPFAKDNSVRRIVVFPINVNNSGSNGNTSPNSSNNSSHGSGTSVGPNTGTATTVPNTPTQSNTGSTNSASKSATDINYQIGNNDKTQPKVENFKTVISTHSMKSLIPIFNIKGKHTGRNLANNTDWAVDKKTMINGELYYRVSTSEWIKAAHVFEYKNKVQTVITKHGDVSSLFNSRGEKIRARSLANNTGWYSDRTAMINGKLHYRVSTAEWLSAEDVQ
ncbi:MucBP domain-containing protein [Companilactobacillus mishanensis]|uniref:MucBP domain-containing protein n=1 Tax=Companilactobacillus mishanensis TaxID=2486008 RepID=A0A5P0ZIA9_9LACO|nr:MucBP domain-containing protein [Companilactobacillus mishanensis]MQS52800.1 hypothetical protein [Companilactobacillus mishanensis]